MLESLFKLRASRASTSLSRGDQRACALRLPRGHVLAHWRL